MQPRMAGWNVTEDPNFSDSVDRCGGAKVIDEALFFIDHGLHINPLGYPAVPGFPNIRIVKTKLQFRGGLIFPAMRMRVWTDEPRKTVTKLHIEISDPEEMEFWDDDDEIPF